MGELFNATRHFNMYTRNETENNLMKRKVEVLNVRHSSLSSLYSRVMI